MLKKGALEKSHATGTKSCLCYYAQHLQEHSILILDVTLQKHQGHCQFGLLSGETSVTFV